MGFLHPHERVPRERVAVLIEGYLSRGWGVQELARCSGVPERTLTRIRTGRDPSTSTGVTSHTSVALLDRFLCGVGDLHLWHLEPEDGGFADIYERSVGSVAA